MTDKFETDAKFNKVYDETFASLKRFVASKCSNPFDIGDILQDTYTDYYRVLTKKGISYIENDADYLFRIAKRKLAKYYSLMQRLRDIFPLPDQDDDYPGLADPCGVEEAVISSAETERILKKIKALPEDTQKLIYLCFNENMSLESISKETGLPLHTVKNKIYRGLKKIRKSEEKNG